MDTVISEGVQVILLAIVVVYAIALAFYREEDE